ncbi:MAG TPA: crossover junction endodeoxyribonuclease RuvC [Candidatus Bathyarchaeia archaeon]|nr:crossover junction endodeoxyribonuclease RuvC [Candidatus Bathyarchaeia archaeon]
MVILGIDPGLKVAGFGILKKEGSKAFLLDYGYLAQTSTTPLVERVATFYHFFDEKIKKWQVTDLALEHPYLGRNTQTFLKLGYLRGSLYLLAHDYALVLHEFSPSEIKMAVTGFGGAEKEQVARVILTLFPQLKTVAKLDVSDALAVTICALWRKNNILARY